MNKYTKAIFSVIAIMVVTLSFVQPISAQGDGSGLGLENNNNSLICDVFPFLGDLGFLGVSEVLCNPSASSDEDTLDSVEGIIRFLLSLIFIGIIGVAIFYIIKSSIKYIRSEGDEGKVQESQKAIKAVFMGVAALMVGIIGLVVILALFNATTALETEDPESVLDDARGDDL
jgi:quinol-cytochrome oxidoreductase complex cytochrome b subunit